MNAIIKKVLELEGLLRDLPPDDRHDVIEALAELELPNVTIVVGVAGAKQIEKRLFKSPPLPITGA